MEPVERLADGQPHRGDAPLEGARELEREHRSESVAAGGARLAREDRSDLAGPCLECAKVTLDALQVAVSIPERLGGGELLGHVADDGVAAVELLLALSGA